MTVHILTLTSLCRVGGRGGVKSAVVPTQLLKGEGTPLSFFQLDPDRPPAEEENLFISPPPRTPPQEKGDVPGKKNELSQPAEQVTAAGHKNGS